MNQNIPFHGSDLEKVSAYYQIPIENITNFGGNINPLGLSPKLRENLQHNIDVITKYPDPDYISLRKCLSNYTGANFEHIIMGNGSTELISLVLQTSQPKRVLMIGPTYSEYEREIRLYGGSITYFFLKEEEDFQFNMNAFKDCLDESISMVILCNPNNPTSTALNKKTLSKILSLCQESNILMMIDETYVEFTKSPEEISAVSLINEYNNLLILRGISKFFAAPGLRLGYGICSNRELLSAMNLRKNPWTINSLAASAGEIMFTDKEYIDETRSYINNERNRIYQRLSACDGIKVYKPSANFVLIKLLADHLTAEDVFQKTIQKGLMIRDCSTFPSLKDKFIRFCFLQQDKNDHLMDEILDIAAYDG